MEQEIEVRELDRKSGDMSQMWSFIKLFHLCHRKMVFDCMSSGNKSFPKWKGEEHNAKGHGGNLC